MKRPKMFGTLIGSVYPFYLDNVNLSAYYMYRVVSPKVDEDLTPLLTFEKVCERTRLGDFSATEFRMNHGDLLQLLMRAKKRYPQEKLVEYIEKSILVSPGDKKKPALTIYPNGIDFPLYGLDSYGGTTKALIIGLRDALRWSQYKFQPGAYMDILLTKDKFGLFEIVGDEKEIWLKPIGIYENTDIERKNPIPIPENGLAGYYPTTKFSGAKRASDLNRAVRQAEWRSFENPEFK